MSPSYYPANPRILTPVQYIKHIPIQSSVLKELNKQSIWKMQVWGMKAQMKNGQEMKAMKYPSQNQREGGEGSSNVIPKIVV